MATLRPIVMGLAVSSILMLCAPRAESQQPLRYVDEHGVAHWVSSKEQIPQKYRDKAEAPELPGISSSAAPAAGPDHDREMWELCQRGTEVKTHLQCEQWFRQQAEERQRRAIKGSVKPQADTDAPPPAAPWGR